MFYKHCEENSNQAEFAPRGANCLDKMNQRRQKEDFKPIPPPAGEFKKGERKAPLSNPPRLILGTSKKVMKVSFEIDQSKAPDQRTYPKFADHVVLQKR
jgi:hypothetical protein